MNKIKSIAFVGYTKVSGLLRDILLVLLLGLSTISDSIFFGMTFIMFFQLIAYQGNINILGKNYKFKAACEYLFKNKMTILLLMFAYALFLIAVFDYSIEKGLSPLTSNLICFVFMSPFAVLAGLIASFGVLKGNLNSHVILTSVQNTAVIISILLIFNFISSEYIFLAWFAGFFCVFSLVNIIYDSAKELEMPVHKKKYSTILSFASPALMFLIILSERFFYTNVEGSLGLIKLLESGAMSITFLLEILFMNSVISKLSMSGHDVNTTYNLFRIQFKKALPVGLLLMLLYVSLLVVLFLNNDLPFEISATIKQYFILLAVLYCVYFLVVLCRDYVERFLFSVNEPKIVTKSNAIILIATLAVNSLLIEFIPISIMITSLILMFFKVIYLINSMKGITLLKANLDDK